MNRQQAHDLIKETFEQPFEKARFIRFIKELLNKIDESKAFHARGDVKEIFNPIIKTYERIGSYESPNGEKLDIVIAYLQKTHSIDYARVTQRNFAGKYLSDRGQKDAGLFAFVTPDKFDWRFSLVKMDYKFEKTSTGSTKVKEEYTPARRWSFLVGANEGSHTAQSRLVKILANDEESPTLADLEDSFNVEIVTKEFFKEYRDLFIRAKEALDKVVQTDAKIKADFEAKGVNTVDFAKKLLGQIVFLYFLQKKGWFGVGRDADWGTGSKQFLRELFEKKHGDYKNFFNDILEPLFYEALRNDRSHDDDYYSRFNCKIPFLNGGLFDPIGNYNWVHADIGLSDSLFSNRNKTDKGDIGDGILDIFDRYNFTVKEDEPLEKEVAIDPELLGKAYEKFNAIRPDNFDEYRKVLNKKGEESKFNKQYGVYYTPREIVHYMCRQSLIHYLFAELNGSRVSYEPLGDNNLSLFGNKDKTGQLKLTVEHKERPKVPIEDIEALINLGEHINENEAWIVAKGKETKTYSHQLSEAIRKNVVLIDQKLADIVICDPAAGSGAFPVGMMSEIVKARTVLTAFIENKKNRKPYDFKRRCIEHSLYGVDIDPGAVEIAKLRLWLSLVVDEDDIKSIKPLPNLDYKIVCGNSLLGCPYVPRGLEKIEKLKEQFFAETNPTRKNELRDRINDSINNLFKTSGSIGYQITMDFNTTFSEVFRREEGFDVVIANPPYVRQEAIKELKPFFKNLYECFTGTADLFVYFYEKGTRILKPNGILCFISSNKYFRSGYGEKLRDFLASKATVIQLIDFGDAPVFDAIAYPSIAIIRKTPPSKEDKTRVFNWEPGLNVAEFERLFGERSFEMPQKELRIDGWRLENRTTLGLLDKLRKIGKPLGEYVNGRFYRGILTGLNEAFVVDKETRDRLIKEHKSSEEVLKPFLRGRDVKRWRVEYQDLWLIFTRRGININKYPAIEKHLHTYKKQLMPGGVDGRKPGSYEWYEIQDNIAYWQEFEQPKIIVPAIANNVQYSIDKDGYYSNDKTSIIVSDQSEYIAGILNSNILWWVIQNIAASKQGGFFEFKPMYVSQLPIPLKPEKEALSGIVSKLAVGKSKTFPTLPFESRLDALVAHLYQLTEPEYTMILNDLKLSEEVRAACLKEYRDIPVKGSGG